MLGSCAYTTVIEVSSSELTPEVSHAWLVTFAEERRRVYSNEDKQVVLNVRLKPNMVGKFRAFLVEWVAPGGNVYLKAPTRTAWGSHQSLVAVMQIKGMGAARLLGPWKVRLSLDGELLAEEAFKIVAPGKAARAARAEAACESVFSVGGEIIGRKCPDDETGDGCESVFSEGGDIIGRTCPGDEKDDGCESEFSEGGDIIGRTCPGDGSEDADSS